MATKDLQQLKELFGDTFSSEDISGVFEEVRGDMQLAIDLLSTGQVECWGQVQKGKKKGQISCLFLVQASNPAKNSTATRGSRRGRGRGGRAGYTSTANTVGHGGEKNAAASAENESTAYKKLDSSNGEIEEDWHSIHPAIKSTDVWEKDEEKLHVGKRFTVIKARKDDIAKENGSAQKKNNWASIVKGYTIIPFNVLDQNKSQW